MEDVNNRSNIIGGAREAVNNTSNRAGDTEADNNRNNTIGGAREAVNNKSSIIG